MKPVHSARLQLRRNSTRRVGAALLVVAGVATTFSVVGASGASHPHAKSVVISTATSAKFGTILVSGRTLYTLKPDATKCAKTCLKYWNAVLLPKGASTPPSSGP
jgi:predicted lipoprotein with Yx(FWY)xxD motif